VCLIVTVVIRYLKKGWFALVLKIEQADLLFNLGVGVKGDGKIKFLVLLISCAV